MAANEQEKGIQINKKDERRLAKYQAQGTIVI